MRTTYYSLGRNLHQRATLTSKVASLLMPKRCSGAGEAIVPLIQDPQKFMEDNLPRRRRYFSTVPGRRNTGLVRLHSTVLFLQDPINCCVLMHVLTLQLPNEVLQMEPARVGKFMTHSCLRQKWPCTSILVAGKTAVTLQTPGTLAVYLDYLLLPTGICFDKNCMYSEHHCTRTVVWQ